MKSLQLVTPDLCVSLDAGCNGATHGLLFAVWALLEIPCAWYFSEQGIRGCCSSIKKSRDLDSRSFPYVSGVVAYRGVA